MPVTTAALEALPDDLTFIVPVPGTHGFRGTLTGRWWCDDSPWLRMLSYEDVRPLDPDNPFVWSTDLNGHLWWRRIALLFRPRAPAEWRQLHPDHMDWAAGGHALSYYFRPPRSKDQYIPVNRRVIVTHSHGLQVWAYACAERAMGGADLKVDRLISIGGPKRKDMEPLYASARRNTRQWLDIHAAEGDRVQLWGVGGDGQLLNRRRDLVGLDGPDWTDAVPGIGHTGVLENPTLFTLWRTLGWIRFLRGTW